MKTKTFSLDLAGKMLTAEFNDLANQTNGSVLLRYAETAILVTAVMGQKPNTGAGYFPLSVEFEEKFYAAGAILGSRFQRREGRPSDEAILSARIVDRTIRPLFNQRIRNDIQVVVTVLAMGEDDPDVLGIIGASLALGVSDIPWHGPVGAVRIGHNSQTGDIILNPTYQERSSGLLDFEILACGKDQTINMIEVAANEVSETDILSVLEASTAIHQQLENWQKEIIAELGKVKISEPTSGTSPELEGLFSAEFAGPLYQTIFSNQAGKEHIYEILDLFIQTAGEQGFEKNTATDYFKQKIDDTLHQGALMDNKRADGRGFDEIRPLFAKAGGISPILHGSGIFYRGDTHIFTALTLGGPDEAQFLDTIEARDTKKRFMHHYNFPPFSVGDTGKVGGFNRRMVGHGALAEKAIAPVIPSSEKFPYTIRLVSETLSSNGSSSMGSVCASTLALMDGGVPITKPVAGIASGVLIGDGVYKVLTDIQGPEDEYGDMDFKVAGTRDGITAIQMDVKVEGIPLNILEEALGKARAARLSILDVITAEISAPRTDISPRAPEIHSLKILPEQIGLVIGSGGKTINSIKKESGVMEITIEDDGSVFVTGKNGSCQVAIDLINTLTKTYTIGEELEVLITRITNFGAFAKLDDKHEGLIHISEIAPFRVEDIEKIIKIGDRVPVVVIKIEDGKIGLSIKKADPNRFSSPQTPSQF